MLAKVASATLVGVQGNAIAVEVHVGRGLPAFNVVGLPDASCRESRDRVRAAIVCSGLSWPQQRITVNLAPTELRKAGAGLDLPIAMAVLVASGQVDAADVEGHAFLGELGLDGTLRPVAGTVALVHALGPARVVVAPQAYSEASLVSGAAPLCAASLAEVVGALCGRLRWRPPPSDPPSRHAPPPADLADVRGQLLGRLAVEVAAAGCHHLLMVGPPGAGKTMLAERLVGLLPDLSVEESLEVTRVHSAAGLALPAGALVRRPPYRAPHHSASTVSLVGGGGQQMRPGELSCAHRGVLFLDELGEFPPAVLDTLRQPLEEGRVLVCRARASVSFPAEVLLVAAMNPCPCGQEAGPGSCRCRDQARARYASRVSGPLLDRFDLRVVVDRPDVDELLGPALGGVPVPQSETTEVVASRVAAARRVALERGYPANGRIPANRLDELAPLERPAARVLETRLRQGLLSARGMHRIRRVARTVADLAGSPAAVREEDVCAALALRSTVLSPGGAWVGERECPPERGSDREAVRS